MSLRNRSCTVEPTPPAHSPHSVQRGDARGLRSINASGSTEPPTAAGGLPQAVAILADGDVDMVRVDALSHAFWPAVGQYCGASPGPWIGSVMLVRHDSPTLACPYEANLGLPVCFASNSDVARGVLVDCDGTMIRPGPFETPAAVFRPAGLGPARSGVPFTVVS
jgi:hypothetical protein